VTPAFGLLLTACALLADPAADKEPSARAEATLQQVVKLPPDYQQVWLRLLEQRCDWAALIMMKPEDAQRERERVAKILHQKRVAWSDMLGLLRQLDQREKASVSRMVRIYRTKVYDSFHRRGKELVDRQEAWYRIWSAWEKAGSPPEQQDRLMDWLADAIKASSKDTLGPLPADPKFGPDVELVPAALVERLRQQQSQRIAAQSLPPRGEEANVPTPEPPLRGPLPLRVPDSRSSIGRTERLRGEGRTMRAAAVLAAELECETPEPLGTTPSVRLPNPRSVPKVELDPLKVTSLPAPSRYAARIVVNSKATDPAPGLDELVVKSGEGAKPQAINGTRPPAELPPPRAVAAPPETSVAGLTPAVSLPNVPSVAVGAAVPETPRQSVPRGDVIAMLPRKLLQSTTIEPEAPMSHTVERKPLSNDAAADDRHAKVNVEELRTRIEGINLSLRTLEGELNDKRELTADQLDGLLSRLDILVLRQKDLALFRDLIAPREQARVGQIDSSRAAIATLGTRIADARTRIRQNESLGEKERAAALKQLDDLSDRLATLTAEK
jgi:hypothetical protein